jgi:apolipoprotein N-acyltransferase
VTALVDPRGRVVTQLPLNQPGTLSVRYARMTTITPYVRFGDWAVLLAALMIPVIAWLGRRENRLI